MEGLNNRQKAQYAALERIAGDYGPWGTGTDADGAHYAPAAANPFKPDLMCGKCSFYESESGLCEIVRGPLLNGGVEANAVCKLWIIPEAPSRAESSNALGNAIRGLLGDQLD